MEYDAAEKADGVYGRVTAQKCGENFAGEMLGVAAVEPIDRCDPSRRKIEIESVGSAGLANAPPKGWRHRKTNRQARGTANHVLWILTRGARVARFVDLAGEFSSE